VKIDTLGGMAVMTELGTETEEIEEMEEIGECQGEMLGVTMTIDPQGETEIFSKAGMTGVGVVAEAAEATVMSSQCRWERGTERRVLVLPPKRRNLHPT